MEPDLRIDPPSGPRRGGCLISSIVAAGLVGLGLLILLPAVNSARNAARASQTT